MSYDVVIVGSGPAGIQASLLLKRANVNCVVVGKHGGSLVKSQIIQNYYGLKEMSGEELYKEGIENAKHLGVEVKEEEVLSTSYNGEEFIVETKENKYQGKHLILATGANRSIPNIKGVKEFNGRGISYCATCDGFFYRNKVAAILGKGDYALSEAKYLSTLASKIYICSDGTELSSQNNKVEIITKKVKEIKGNTKVDEVVFEDDSSIKVDGVFIAYSVAGSFDFAKQIGAELTIDNHVKVGANYETSVPNLYVVGDANEQVMQVFAAVYQGGIAARDIINKMQQPK